MRKTKTLKKLLAICGLFATSSTMIVSSALSQDLPTPTAPTSQTAAQLVALSISDPAAVPSAVVKVLDSYKTSVSDSEFTAVASLIIKSIAEENPDALLSVMREVLKKYPDLAIPLVKSSLGARPSMVESVAEVVMTTCPDLNTSDLSLAIAEATGKPAGSFGYLFSGFEQSGVYIPQLGGGGSPIYQR